MVSFVLLIFAEDKCQNTYRFYPWSHKYQGICYKNSLEETLFKKLNLSIHNAHSEVLYEWLNQLESLKGKKHSLVHFDARKN